MDTFTPPRRPKSSTVTRKVRENSNNFGDGYQQDIVDGINAVYDEVSLSWELLTFEQFGAIDTFLSAHRGQTFLWNLPGCTAKKWRCSEWSPTYERGLVSLTITLKEVFA